MADITLVHDCDVARRGDGSSPTQMGGDFRDTYIEYLSPSINHGDANTAGFGVFTSGGKGGGENERRALLYYDLFSFLPRDATIVSAFLQLYVPNTTMTDTQVVTASRCTRTDWVEDEVTWDDYKSGSPWTAAGGDMSTPTLTLTEDYDTVGWKAEDITSLVTDAWNSRGGICTFFLYRDDGQMANAGTSQLNTKEVESTFGGYWKTQHLRVTYTLDSKTFQAFVFDGIEAAVAAERRRLAQVI